MINQAILQNFLEAERLAYGLHRISHPNYQFESMWWDQSCLLHLMRLRDILKRYRTKYTIRKIETRSNRAFPDVHKANYKVEENNGFASLKNEKIDSPPTRKGTSYHSTCPLCEVDGSIRPDSQIKVHKVIFEKHEPQKEFVKFE